MIDGAAVRRDGRRLGAVLGGLILLATVTGCGTDQAREEPTGVPITDRALAVVAADHAGTPYHAQVDNHPYGFRQTIAAAEVSYPVPTDDGDAVTVQVGTGLQDEKGATCEAQPPRGGCFEQDGAWVTWSPEIPEEDPGAVRVVSPRDDGVYVSVVLIPSDRAITGDPRRTRLVVPLDDLVAIANDERLDRTTDQATVDAGEQLDYWTFG